MKCVKTRAVIFDMDGVITNTMPAHFRVWRRLFYEAGMPVTRLDIYAREGQKGMESLREIFALYRKPFSEEIGRALLAEKERRFKETIRCRFIPGARRFLRQMKAGNFRMALVTGTSRHEMERLLPPRIRSMFEVQVCGCEVQNGKPHPEPYLTALSGLGLSAQNGLVIENAPFGIRSAKAAGLRCLALATSLPPVHLRQADGVFRSFTDLSARVTFQNHEI